MRYCQQGETVDSARKKADEKVNIQYWMSEGKSKLLGNPALILKKK
jgi:hypothetical protein